MQIPQVLLEVLQRLTLSPMVGIVIEVAEEFPVLFLPVSELGCHGHKLSGVKGYVWCFFGIGVKGAEASATCADEKRRAGLRHAFPSSRTARA